MVQWKPLSIKYPSDENQWMSEYTRYQEFPEYQQSQLNLEEFKEIYWIEYSHRLYARAMGLYLVIPLAIFWKKKMIPSALKPRLLAITGMFGIQGLLGWFMVQSGLQHKDYDGRVKVEPINLAVHLFCGVGLYAFIFSTALNCLKKKPEEIITTLNKLNAAKIARRKYMMLFHLALGTIFSGALVAGSDAGKVLNNWPFYGENLFFPDDALDIQPVYKNFIENKSMIQFVHRNFGYLTYLSAGDLWFYMYSVKTILPYMGNAHLIMLVSTYQVVLGITALMRGTPLIESLTHQVNGMVFLTTILYGLKTFRRPNKEFIAKLMGK